MEPTHDVIVIGAGQAGLATGYWLSRARVDFVTLDGVPRVGDGWRRYWDSLRLFSPARSNALPGMVFPGDPSRLPTKDEVADYLEAYAARFDLPVVPDARVSRERAETCDVDAGDRLPMTVRRDKPPLAAPGTPRA